MKKLSSGGFSSVALIISVVILVAVGFAGWRILNRQQVETTEDPTTQEEVSDPTEGGKYFVISEWGIRFPISREIGEDLYYKTYSNEVPLEGVAFASKQLDSLVENGFCTFLEQGDGKVYGTGFEDLTRQKKDEAKQLGLDFIKNLGDYSYSSISDTRAEVSCVPESLPKFNEIFELEKNLSQELRKAFEELSQY